VTIHPQTQATQTEENPDSEPVIQAEAADETYCRHRIEGSSISTST
jgi:hypothetical protein